MNNRYYPPYSITPMIVHRVASIMELLGQIKAKSGSELWLPQMKDVFRLEAIQSSLAIENNPYSIEEMRSMLMSPEIRTKNRAQIEVLNAQKLYTRIEELESGSQQDLLKAHHILMDTLVEDAGRYRKRDVGIYQGSKVIFMAPGSSRVTGLMNRLFDYITSSEDHYLITSCVFHYEFEFIHPFSDGNGRLGRYWQKLLLAEHNEVFYHLAIEKTIYQYQQEYYLAISRSHQAGESTPFIEFMLKVIHETILDALTIVSTQHSIQVGKLLDVMEIGVAYQPKKLMELVNLKSRSSFFNHYIKPAIASGRIERAFPEQPRSRFQRYIRLW